MTTIEVFGETAKQLIGDFSLTTNGDTKGALCKLTLKSIEGRAMVEVEI